MAESVLSVTLGKLFDLLLEEARFLHGVSNQVREIQGQLEMMKSFLIHADRRQHNEDRVRTWTQQVRRLAYRTEDVLETYAVEVASSRGKNINKLLKRFASIFSEGKALHNVGKEIASIKSDITNLNMSCQTFGIKDLSEGERSKEAREKQRLLRQTYPHEVQEHFVGMEDNIRALLSLITDDERDHGVISIWGMGGLGKTTLARKIFNHDIVQRSFEGFAWACITQQCQTAVVLQDILQQLGHATQGDQTTTLVREVYKILKQRKCLLILDDIWELDDWKILCPAFPIAEGSSKILLTTRVMEVAKEGFPYKLNFLSEAEGWELLRRKSLVDEKEKGQTFDVVGNQLVRKCGYLPLAISVVGGILRHKNSVKEWEIVNKELDLYLERENGGNKEASKSVQKVLGLSYDELPYYLKPCFLYIGRYPEDAKIMTEQLYRLWIAEGFVLSKHRRGEETMNDVAERYLHELATRCMVDVKIFEVESYPQPKYCVLHDLMRDFCLDKGKEEDFFKILDITGQLPQLPAIALSDCERKLSVSFAIEVPQCMIEPSQCQVDLSEKVKSQYLRSLYVDCSYIRSYFADRMLLLDMSMIKKFKLLRVLVLENCRFELPTKTNELIHLRYLDLSGSCVKRLPSSISSLPYLETLVLSRVDFIYLPNIFWKMKQLKHIYLPFLYQVREKLQFNNLHELETLDGFQSSKCKMSGLVNLRSFNGSAENINSHALSQIIDEMNSWRKTKSIVFSIAGCDLTNEHGTTLLRKVFLCENLNRLVIKSTPIIKFPPYEPQFRIKLLELGLFTAKMEEDPMQFLKKLPNLRKLQLSHDAFEGKEMVCDATAFPQLKYLTLHGFRNMEKWRVDKGALPNLSHLFIYECPKLEEIADGLNFSALEQFLITGLPEEVKQKYNRLYVEARKKLHS